MSLAKHYLSAIPSVCWGALGAYTGIKSEQLGLGSFNNPGPGFMPFVGALILIVLSAFLFVEELGGKGEIQKQLNIGWQKILGVLLGIMIFGFLIFRGGYIVTTFLSMLIFFTVTRLGSWRYLLLYSLAASLLSYVIFDVFLHTRLPRGPLGF